MTDYMTVRHLVNGKMPVAAGMVFRHALWMNFGQWLKENRNAYGVSQEWMADKLGVQQSTLAKWERGGRQPRNYEAMKEKAEAVFADLNRSLTKPPDSDGGEQPEGEPPMDDATEFAVEVLDALSREQRRNVIRRFLQRDRVISSPSPRRRGTTL